MKQCNSAFYDLKFHHYSSDIHRTMFKVYYMVSTIGVYSLNSWRSHKEYKFNTIAMKL